MPSICNLFCTWRWCRERKDCQNDEALGLQKLRTHDGFSLRRLFAKNNVQGFKVYKMDKSPIQSTPQQKISSFPRDEKNTWLSPGTITLDHFYKKPKSGPKPPPVPPKIPKRGVFARVVNSLTRKPAPPPLPPRRIPEHSGLNFLSQKESYEKFDFVVDEDDEWNDDETDPKPPRSKSDYSCSPLAQFLFEPSENGETRRYSLVDYFV